MKSIFNRVSIGFIATALVLAQVVMPVQAAFAYTAPTGEVKKVDICHATDSITNPYEDNNTSVNAVLPPAGHGEHTGQVWNSTFTNQDKWGDIIPPFDYAGPGNATLHYDGLNWNEDGQAIYNNDCKIPTTTPQPISVTAVNGTITDSCGPTMNAWFDPTPTTGVAYHPVISGNTITVTAIANTGYTLSNPDWSQTYTDQLVSCETELPKDATAQIVVSEPACRETGIASITSVTHATLVGTLSQAVGTHTATFAADAGHLFANGTNTLETTYTIKPSVDCETPPYTPPATPPCVEDVTTGLNGKVYDSNNKVIFERYIDRWGDNTRVGAGTTNPLYNVTLTVAYDHLAGIDAINSQVTPGWGAVDPVLRQAYVPGIDMGTAYQGQQGTLIMHNADIIGHAVVSGNYLIVTIGYMPAGSSFSFNAGNGVINAVLNGQREAQCVEPVFPPTTCEMATGSVIATFDDEKFIYTVSGPGLDGEIELQSGKTTYLTFTGTYTANAYTFDGEELVKVASWEHVNPVLDCTPGKGGEGPTPTPVTPSKGEALPSKLPQLLPHTGPSDTTSARGLLIALIAAIATYGAIYFAQGKRRYE